MGGKKWDGATTKGTIANAKSWCGEIVSLKSKRRANEKAHSSEGEGVTAADTKKSGEKYRIILRSYLTIVRKKNRKAVHSRPNKQRFPKKGPPNEVRSTKGGK